MFSVASGVSRRISPKGIISIITTENGCGAIHDDRRLFEFLTLEAAQAGLSWYTVLRKRHGYRVAFDHFDPENSMKDDGCRWHRSWAIRMNSQSSESKPGHNNARRVLEVQEAFGSFATYLWRFVGQPMVHEISTLNDYPATSPESDTMSKDLRHRGLHSWAPRFAMLTCRPRGW